MARALNVIDADGHILEPLNLWSDYIEPKYRDKAPKLIRDADGKQRLQVGEQLLGSKKGLGALGGVGARDGTVVDDAMEYEQGRKGGFDPHARIPDMDLDGIDAAFLYPSIGLFAGAVDDPPTAAAMSRAYNRWLADYCKPYPDRLFGIAMIPMQNVDLAIEEMRFAREKLGFRGVFLRPNPYNGKMIHHPDYEKFWTMVEELDMSVGFHEGGNSGMMQVGMDRFEERGARHIITHTMEMMLACMAVIWGGVCERHPKVRIAFLEFGRRLDRRLAGPHGPPLRRQGVQRFRSEDPPVRAVQAQLLDRVRAGRALPEAAGRLCRRQQDPMGHRLSASRRLLPRRAGDGSQADRGCVEGDGRPGDGRRREGVLRAALSPSARAEYGPRWRAGARVCFRSIGRPWRC